MKEQQKRNFKKEKRKIKEIKKRKNKLFQLTTIFIISMWISITSISYANL